MESDITLFLAWALMILILGVPCLYMAARGLEQTGAVLTVFWQGVVYFLRSLPNIFNADTALARSLRRKGIDPALADKIAETTAELLTDWLKPYLPEVAPVDSGAGVERP